MPAYPKPLPRIKKPPCKIRHVTPKRAALERQKTNTYRTLSEEKPPYCEGCGCREYENSHRISQNDRTQIANPKNVDRLCRNCHLAYESGRLWYLDNAVEIFEFLRETDYQRYAAKAYQMADRINEAGLKAEDLPGWVAGILEVINS